MQSMARKQVSTTLDEETIKAAEAWGIAAGYSSMFETYRELILTGLRCKTEKPHASAVRAQVKEELDMFTARLDLRFEILSDELAAAVDDASSAQAEATSIAAMTALKIVSDMAACQPGEVRTADEIRADAAAEVWGIRSRLSLANLQE